MNFYVKHSLPGRLRIRYDKSEVSPRQAALAKSLLSVQEGMVSVDVNYITGSYLIYYDSSLLDEERVGAFFHALGPKYLDDPDMLKSVGEVRKQESLLQALLSMTVQHYAKMLLPAPLRAFFRVFSLSPRIVRGLSQVARGRIFKADVLDATAIGMALLTGDPKTASNINFLLDIGETIEEFTKKKSYSDLADTMMSDHDMVQVVQQKDGRRTEQAVPLYMLKRGDTVVVRTGAIVPADGDVVGGEALVNQAAITGEPIAVEKREGSSVFAGTVLQEGELYVLVRETGSGTKIQNILSMIDSSQQLKVSSQVRSEHLADTLVRYNFILSLLTFLVTRDISKVMATLMVDYSCAMKLAAPITVLSAMKESAQHGILVKGGKFLEDAAKADTVVFDKTGTLTAASPALSRIILCADRSEEHALMLAACLEEHFAHPVANAIVQAAKDRNLVHPEEHAKVEYIVAHGIASSLNGERLLVGSRHFVFEDERIPEPDGLERIQKEALDRGESLLYLAEGGKTSAVFAITDPIRPNAAQIIGSLRGSGVASCAMITGDDEGAARTAAETARIDYYRSRALPEDKVRYINAQKKAGHKVIMIGDGINDAPALAAADTGIAMGDSAAIAGETADIVLSAKDGLDGLYKTRILGQRMMRRIDGDNRAIIAVNSALIALGLLGWISPALAAILHNTSTIAIGIKAAQPLIGDLAGKMPATADSERQDFGEGRCSR